MAVTDPYFRFPLSALTYGETSLHCMHIILDHSIFSAGVGARTLKPADHEALAAACALPNPPRREHEDDWTAYLDVCVGAQLTQAHVGDWQSIKTGYEMLHKHTSELPKSALVTINAKWVWNALDTARMEAGQPTLHENAGYLSWREFRVLCAVLSVIGAKPYAWVSTNTLLHRVCGYTAASSFKGKEPAAHCPRLTRWMLETTLNRLEELRFFLRVRVSRSPTGRGGRTAYSIRHPSREALVIELRTSLFATVADNRKADHQLWTQGVGAQSKWASSPIISKFSPQVGFNSPTNYG